MSQCLYERLGQGDRQGQISQALEQLRELNLLSYSEKTGYKLQSSAGQEWARERDSYSIIPNESSAIVADKLSTSIKGGVRRSRSIKNGCCLTSRVAAKAWKPKLKMALSERF